MLRSAQTIGAAIMAIQEAYLDTPSLSLTEEEALRRWGLEATELEALVDVLETTGLLARDHGRIHRRHPAPLAA